MEVLPFDRLPGRSKERYGADFPGASPEAPFAHRLKSTPKQSSAPVASLR